VALRGGNLTIEWQGENASLVMTGDAKKVFDGKIKL
jgi:diaminopimelate epimerase